MISFPVKGKNSLVLANCLSQLVFITFHLLLVPWLLMWVGMDRSYPITVCTLSQMLLPEPGYLSLFYLNKQSQEELKKLLVHESSSPVANIFTYEKHGWWHCVSVGLFKKVCLSIFFFEINRMVNITCSSLFALNNRVQMCNRAFRKKYSI